MSKLRFSWFFLEGHRAQTFWEVYMKMQGLNIEALCTFHRNSTQGTFCCSKGSRSKKKKKKNICKWECIGQLSKYRKWYKIVSSAENENMISLIKMSFMPYDFLLVSYQFINSHYLGPVVPHITNWTDCHNPALVARLVKATLSPAEIWLHFLYGNGLWFFAKLNGWLFG